MEEMTQKEQTVAKKKMPPQIWWIGGIVALVVATVAFSMSGSISSGTEKVRCKKIETPYIELLIPQELEGVITDEASTYGATYIHAFYMNYGEKTVPLWRLDFGDTDAGAWIGMLETDKGDISVVMTGFVISEEEAQELGEEGYVLYSKCMDAYTIMLEGIMSDPRFTSERPLAVGEDTKVKMTHWQVTLPDTMAVTENTADGVYEAVFYGDVVGEGVALYRISIGEEKEDVPLGYFTLDGEKKPVYVESFTLTERESWSEDDYAAAYHMMDTINHVIDVIMQSKQFSTEAE